MCEYFLWIVIILGKWFDIVEDDEYYVYDIDLDFNDYLSFVR